MNVIIPVAGKGTRMRPFTHSKPKPILPVAGKPMIEHILERVLPLEPTNIYFITGYLKKEFEEYMRSAHPDLSMKFCEQQAPLGTADAIWTAKEAFDEDVLIIFSDTLFDADLSEIAETDAAGLIWAKEVEDPSRFGVIVEGDDGAMQRMVEKPKEFVSNLANIGIYYVKDTALLAEGIEHVYATREEGKELFLTGAFQYMIDNRARIEVPRVEGWYDCGTTDETLRTNAALLDGKNSIHPDAIVENSTIGKNVHIGARAHIVDCTLNDCIVDEDAELVGCTLSDSIVGEHVRAKGYEGKILLGAHSVLE